MNEEKIVPVKDELKKNDTVNIIKEIALFIVIAVCVVWPFRTFVAEPFIVSGSSMDPTFKTGNYLIVDKLSYELGSPQRDSVIVFKFPETAGVPAEEGKDLIKRVIGLPGDTLTLNGDTVTITNKENPNGFTLDESYLVHTMPLSYTVTLGPDQYFVMGDNRPASYDSRSWGVLPKSDIIGRPIMQLWPLSQIRVLPGDDTNNQYKK